MKSEIFLPLIGEYENVGDIILRRPLADWLRPLGRLHVFLGRAPKGYERALRLASEDLVYHSFPAWYKAGLAYAARGRAHYVFKPGEIQLTLVGMKEHLSMLPLIALARGRGGRVLRIGSGSRNFAALPRLLMRPSVGLSDMCVWRDPATASYIGVGSVMPDLAFADGDPIADFGPIEGRRLLVVSLRGDRPPPTDDWLQAIRALARSHSMEVFVVTQVLRDEQRTQYVASALGAEAMGWDGQDHDRHEARLLALYRKTRVVLSDRLHVLIAACAHGAVPVGISTDHEDKIRRHFSAAAVPIVVTDMSSVDSIRPVLMEVGARALETRAALTKAREELAKVRTRMGAMLSSTPTSSTVEARS